MICTNHKLKCSKRGNQELKLLITFSSCNNLSQSKVKAKVSWHLLKYSESTHLVCVASFCFGLHAHTWLGSAKAAFGSAYCALKNINNRLQPFWNFLWVKTLKIIKKMMKSSFGGFQAAFLNFMPKRDAEVITEAPPTIDPPPNFKRKNIEQSTPSSLKKPKVLSNLFPAVCC